MIPEKRPDYGAFEEKLFLPNFCSGEMILSLIVIAELLAIILATASRLQSGFWEHLGLISLFVQWIALCSLGLLCAFRSIMICLADDRLVALLSYTLLLVTTVVISMISYWVVINEGNPGLLAANSQLEFVLENLCISAIVSGMTLRYFYIQHQWRTQIKAETQVRLEALQARIRPHFLFNSMNTIASLTRTNPEVAEEVVEDLADLFRVCLADNRSCSSLHEELLLIHQYLQIENHRLGNRLRITWQIDGIPEDAVLPPMTLQPLLENAVYHGVEPASEGGDIRVCGDFEKGRITLRICNTLPADGSTSIRKGNHLAMANTKARIAHFYNNEGQFTSYIKSNQFCVELSFPYWQERV